MENQPRRRRRAPAEQPMIAPQPMAEEQEAPVRQRPAPAPAQLPQPERKPPAAPPPAAPRKNGKKKKKKKKSGRKWLIILLILLLLAVLIAGGILVYKVNQKREFERYQFDTSAMEGRIQMMTEEEIQAELNRVVEEGMFNISIASSVVFDPKTEMGEARIENIHANNYHMQVDIFLDDTGELVYSSKLIQPGYSIEHIKLDRKLAPGEYRATAIFSAITKKELQLFGQAGAQIKLYIPDEDGKYPTPTPAPTSSPAP